MFIKHSHKKQLLHNMVCVASLVNNNFVTFLMRHYIYYILRLKFYIIIIQMGTLQFAKLHSKFNVL